MEREMVRTEGGGGGGGEERIRNGRTDDVEGKGRGDRKRVEVKGGKKEEEKKVGLLFLWSVPWVW